MSSTTTDPDTDEAAQARKKSATIAESAESLRENLVIDHKSCDEEDIDEEMTSEKKMAFSAVEKSQNMEDNCLKEVKKDSDVPHLNHRKTTPKNSNSTSSKSDDTEAPSAAEITLVKSGKKTYTKIIPTHTHPSLSMIRDTQVQDNRSKRLKEDPHLKHLQLHSRPKAPLLRSTSMPVCVDDLEEGDKHTEDEKSGILQHRKIYRTGSISDYTKQKLKSTILMKTSASLVRKPSITDFEMRQIQADADSSQSDDEDEEEEEGEGRFKAVTSDNPKHSEESKETASTSTDNSCRKNVLNVTSSPCVVSSLPEASVTLAVAMTSA